ncbi:MAG: 16S rRNA (uracil(1498)-N(3))-methyltransferase [Planctomycetes bacterium]|nr:16S rRNA (uracil(1498)-N(3))-methyltransferase [Planctomycetota bacterium]
MPWYFVSGLLEPGPLSIRGEEAAHIARASRRRAGDEITLFNGRGSAARAVLTAVSRDSVDVEVDCVRVLPSAGPPALTLGVGLVSADSLSDALHASVPSGLQAFVPLLAERSQWGRRSGPPDKLAARLERVVTAACKQSCCPYLPEIHAPATLEQLLVSDAWDAVVIAVALHEARSATEVLPEAAASSPSSVLLLIGPEGGFSEEEFLAARQSGALPVRIAPYVLRAEYAAGLLAGMARAFLGGLS